MCEGKPLDEFIAEEAADDEWANAFMGQMWLYQTLDTLVEARKQSGLTQEQVAERMGTTQSAIARLEHDAEGGLSLRRLLTYANACGFMPRSLQLNTLWAERVNLRSAYQQHTAAPAARGDRVGRVSASRRSDQKCCT